MIWPTRNKPSSAEPPAEASVGAAAVEPAAPAQPVLGKAGTALTPLPLRGWSLVVLVAGYLAGFAVTGRLLVAVEDMSDLPWYIGLLVAFFVLFSFVWVRPRMHPLVLHLILLIQCVIVVWLVVLEPEFDYVISFFPLLAYQAALVFRGRTRWIWVGALAVLAGGSLMIPLGAARGLGLALTTIAIGVALPALALASQEIEAARVESRGMVAELEATNQQLQQYAIRAEDLAVVEERNRLARELHDSVSQAMFSILLATRSAQIMGEKEPEALPVQLEQLQALTQDALARMRGFIAELRPKS